MGIDVIMPDSVRSRLKKQVERKQELIDQMTLIAMKMQRIMSRLLNELDHNDKAAIETHKELVKNVESLAPIIEELVREG